MLSYVYKLVLHCRPAQLAGAVARGQPAGLRAALQGARPGLLWRQPWALLGWPPDKQDGAVAHC